MDIIIKHMDFAYADHQVFKDFNLTIKEGEIVTIMGASGCGKTTLLQILTGQLVPQSGEISGIGKDISQIDIGQIDIGQIGAGRKDTGQFGTASTATVTTNSIGMVFQENRLCEDFTAALNIRIATGKDKKTIAAHLQMVGLEQAVYKKVSELSGGMKRRVAIVRAMLSDSSLLILDEPLKGLDVGTKEQVLAYIKAMRKGRTMILVTHDSDEASYFEGTLVNMPFIR